MNNQEREVLEAIEDNLSQQDNRNAIMLAEQIRLLLRQPDDSVSLDGLSEVTKKLIGQIVARDQHGLKKYGTNLDREDLNLREWLQHMAEELMDGAGYALAAKRVTEIQEQQLQNLESRVLYLEKYNGRQA